MGVRHMIAGAVLALPLAGGGAGMVRAGEPAPPADPVVTITPAVILGGTIEASMECHWVDPSVELEPLIPTWNMVAPDGTSVVADDVSGDAGTVMASWAATQVGEWGLFVTCGAVTEVFTSIVGPVPTTLAATTTMAPPTSSGSTNPDTTVRPPGPLPSTGASDAPARLATGLVVAGLAAVLVARRRRPA